MVFLCRAMVYIFHLFDFPHLPPKGKSMITPEGKTKYDEKLFLHFFYNALGFWYFGYFLCAMGFVRHVQIPAESQCSIGVTTECAL